MNSDTITITRSDIAGAVDRVYDNVTHDLNVTREQVEAAMWEAVCKVIDRRILHADSSLSEEFTHYGGIGCSGLFYDAIIDPLYKAEEQNNKAEADAS
jgi:hypothetical protein